MNGAGHSRLWNTGSPAFAGDDNGETYSRPRDSIVARARAAARAASGRSPRRAARLGSCSSPLAVLVVSAFKPSGLLRDPDFTLAHVVETSSDPQFWSLVWATLQFATGSTAVALVLGGALAWLVERTDLPAPTLVRALVILPMATPPFLLAISWIILLSPRTGVINSLLIQTFGLDAPPFNIYSLGGMILVEGLALVPSAFLILAPAARQSRPEPGGKRAGVRREHRSARLPHHPAAAAAGAGGDRDLPHDRELRGVRRARHDRHAVAHLRPLQPDLQPGGGQPARNSRIRQGERHGADVHRGPARAHSGVSPADAARGPLRDRDRARLPAASVCARTAALGRHRRGRALFSVRGAGAAADPALDQPDAVPGAALVRSGEDGDARQPPRVLQQPVHRGGDDQLDCGGAGGGDGGGRALARHRLGRASGPGRPDGARSTRSPSCRSPCREC